MGLDASVRCRCFEEGKLRPGPVPLEDLYIDDEGYLSSRKIDGAHSRFTFRQVWARYYDLERSFQDWLKQPCEHIHGAICSEWVDNWSGVNVFGSYCEEIGEERLPILSHILPHVNGGTFPAKMAQAALDELDYFDEWLDREMTENPTSTLVDLASGEELWSPEERSIPIVAPVATRAEMVEGLFRIVSDDSSDASILFASSHFCHEWVDGLMPEGVPRRYKLTCLDTGVSIECSGGFEFCSEERTEIEVGSRKAECWTSANVSLRNLLNASLETGNPIRWI